MTVSRAVPRPLLRWLRARPLGGSVIGVIFLITSASLGVHLFLGHRAEVAVGRQQLEARLQADARALAESLVLPVWNLDQPQIRRILMEEAKLPFVTRVEVTFGTTHPRRLGFARDASGILRELQGPPDPGAVTAFEAGGAILQEASPIGALRLQGTDRPLLADLRYHLRIQFLQLTLLGLLLAGALYLLLWKLVLQPIQVLKAYADGQGWETGDRLRSRSLIFSGELEDLRRAVTFAFETEHQRLEALALSESRARSLVELAPEGILLVDTGKPLIREVNPAAEALFGLDRAALLGRDLLSLRAPDVADLTLPSEAELQELLDQVGSGQPRDCRMAFLTAGGHPKICEVRLVLQPSQEGSALRVSLLDITSFVLAERRTEETLERLSRLKAALDSSAIVATTDASGTLTSVNEQFCRISKYSEAELVGQNHRILRSGHHPPAFYADLWGTITSGRTWRGEIRNRAKDGTLYWVDTTIVPLLDEVGAVEEYLAIRFDISERKRVEEELRKLSRIVEQSEVQILVADVHGAVEYANPAYLQASGRPLAELQTSNLWLLEMQGLDAAQEHAFWEALASGQPWQGELGTLDAAGGRLLALQLSLLQDEAGQASHLILLKRDITQQRRVEAEHKSLESQLHQAQKLEAVGQLAGGIAHDMNNMLTSVLGHVELLRLKLPADPGVRKHLEGIETTALRSRDIVANILAFSRQQMASPKAMDLNTHLTRLRATLEPLISEDIAIRFEPGEGLWPLLADPAQVDQVLMNLVVNARDAMPHGGELTISTGNHTPDEAFLEAHPGARPGRFVRLSVRDTGTGMDELTQARIFEPFFTTKPAGKGTGLGLSTLIGIVKQNQGFVTVRSRLGEGTTFEVHLPALEDVQAPASPAPDGGGGAWSPAPLALSVLLVEDDPLLRQVVLGLVRKLGYACQAAETPQEALDLAADPREDIDLLLSDVVMPEMNGKELAEAFKALRPHVPVLFMSGYSADILGPHGVLESGVHLIQKPFTMEALAAMIGRILQPT